MGQALDLGLVWDGYDVINTLSRIVKLDEKLVLDKRICEYQQNRDPYLMIDFASEIVPGAQAIYGFNK